MFLRVATEPRNGSKYSSQSSPTIQVYAREARRLCIARSKKWDFPRLNLCVLQERKKSLAASGSSISTRSFEGMARSDQIRNTNDVFALISAGYYVQVPRGIVSIPVIASVWGTICVNLLALSSSIIQLNSFSSSSLACCPQNIGKQFSLDVAPELS